jgi:hypothetical protein
MSQTQHEVQTEMPPMVVDRSPELARGAGPSSNDGTYHARNFDADSYINGSVPGDGETCVLANVLRNAFPGYTPHIEGEHPYAINTKGDRIDLIISPILVQEIGKFDRGEPGAFAGMNIGINISN